MAKYRNYKNKLEMFLASRKGRRFLNVAYSWGAAIVILGALFKLLHWPFGNQMLFIGMMTEFLVFFISGLEKPEEHYKWEQVYPELLSINPLDTKEVDERRKYLARKAKEAKDREDLYDPISPSTTCPSSSQTPALALNLALPEEEIDKLASSLNKLNSAVERLTQLSDASATTLESYHTLLTNQDGISKETEDYKQYLTAVNRSMASLGEVYESQLKDITGQVACIDDINHRLDAIRYAYQDSQIDSDTFRRENAQMVQRIRELNGVYARLLDAMTINMATSPFASSYRSRDYYPEREERRAPQYPSHYDERPLYKDENNLSDNLSKA